MLKINTEIILDNGIVINWLLLTLVSIRKNEIELTFDTFSSKDLLDKVAERKKKTIENLTLAEEFKALMNDIDSNKDKLDELQDKINKLSDEVENLPEYESAVISSFSITIPYSHSEIIDKNFMIEQLKEHKFFEIKNYE